MELGSEGTAPMAMQTAFGEQIVDVDVKIDEEILQKIAATTDAKYFRAVDNKSLEKIYAEIDQLEKSKIDVNIFQNKSEEFFWICHCRNINSFIRVAITYNPF